MLRTLQFVVPAFLTMTSAPTDPNSHRVDLDPLIDAFYPGANQKDSPLGVFDPIDRIDTIEGPLLDHNHHMTVTVERHYGCPVRVDVHRFDFREGWYVREITLRETLNDRVVQYGIVRMNPSVLDPEVWKKIESRQIPLGRVLIEHEVLREVQLQQLWRIRRGPALAGYLEQDAPSPVFGRTALIWCDHQPTIELLEILANPA